MTNFTFFPSVFQLFSSVEPREGWDADRGWFHLHLALTWCPAIVGLNFSTSGFFLPPPTATIFSLSLFEQSNPVLTPVRSENKELCGNQEPLSKRRPTISDCGLCHKGMAGGQCNSNFPLTSLQSPFFMEVSSFVRYRVLFCHLFPWLNLFKDYPQFKSNSKSSTFLSVTRIF